MKTFEFKKLELKHEDSWIKRTLTSAHFKKTVLYALIGAVIGYAWFYIGQDSEVRLFWNDDAKSGILMGLAVGIFITNSPCARGKC